MVGIESHDSLWGHGRPQPRTAYNHGDGDEILLSGMLQRRSLLDEDSRSTANEAVRLLAQAIRALRTAGVIRSWRLTGDLGEWYVEQLYEAERATRRDQKGWDLRLPATEERLQVKTQTYDPENKWNYLQSDLEHFDRLVVVILTDTLTLRDLYDIPASKLRSVMRLGTDKKLSYSWNDLEPWRVDLKSLSGYAALRELLKE
jgi:hypothetical protein